MARYSLPRMTRWRIILVCVALALGATAHAQSTREEDRAFEVASKSFDGEFWARAEQEWRDFTIRFPLSPRIPEAVLYQAQAMVEQEKYAGAVQLLRENLGQAGAWADQYLFWIAEAHFRAGNYTAAAQAFEQVVLQYPASDRVLEARLGQAASRARLKQWRQVIAVLQKPDGSVARVPQSAADHLVLARCHLLLAEAYLGIGQYQAARTALQASQLDQLTPTLEWQKQHLLARTWLALGQLSDALAASSNLVAMAAGQRNLVADAVLFQGRVLEEMGEVDQSVAAYRLNLSTNVPPATQRQTLLRLSELLISRDRLADARSVIEQFIALNPDPATADLARLTVAELKMRQHFEAASSTRTTSSTPTNLLSQALADLNEVIQSALTPRLRGRAYLDKGWAEWMRGNFAESSQAFEQAAELLPPSEDQVTARFKWADARFRLGDFEGARTNYAHVVESAPAIGGAALTLVEPALYQELRAGLKLDRPDLTTNALQTLLSNYPDGYQASTSVLLTGQELNAVGDPAGARSLFQKFLETAPRSPLAAEIRLAIARTYEAQGDWTEAVQRYDSILAATNTPSVLARAAYFRALDTAFSGDETNALSYFTDFVVQYASSDLAPTAQWWIGDYYWQRGDYVNAELNYQLLFKNWPNARSDLAYEARMMAGRAAMARLNVTDAINYFTNLTSTLKCPPKLKAQAMFAYGDALMRLKSTATNDPLANYARAIKVFSSIERNYPTNKLAARARGMMGDCYLQLATLDARAYESASNAYQGAMDAPAATLSVRSQAEVGLATVMEKLAADQKPEARAKFQQMALDHYLNVFYEKNLREDEQPDLFWVKKAGLEAGRLAESLQAWPQALKLYERLEAMIPALEPLLQNKILKARMQVVNAQT